MSIASNNNHDFRLKVSTRRRGKPIDFKRLNRTIDWRNHIAKEHTKLSEHLFSSRESFSACPVCASSDYKEFVCISGYPYVECDSCGHIFLQTPPSPEAVTAFYNGEGQGRCSQGDMYIGEELFKQRIEQIAGPKVDYCSSIIPVEGLWVDIGCATGEILMAARNKGWQVRGVEIDPTEIEFGRNHGLDIIQSDINSLDPKELCDAKVLSMVNVLEHLIDPVNTLNNVTRAIPSNSYVIIEVPRHPSLSSYASLVFPNLPYRHIYAPCHLHIFTEKSMDIMLKSAGLEAIAVWVFGQDFLDLIFRSAANAQIQENEFFDKVINLSANVQQSIDEMDFADTLFVIASKI